MKDSCNKYPEGKSKEVKEDYLNYMNYEYSNGNVKMDREKELRELRRYRFWNMESKAGKFMGIITIAILFTFIFGAGHIMTTYLEEDSERIRIENFSRDRLVEFKVVDKNAFISGNKMTHIITLDSGELVRSVKVTGEMYVRNQLGDSIELYVENGKDFFVTTEDEELYMLKDK